MPVVPTDYVPAIVAQALVEGVSVLSSDRQLDAYGIRRLAPES